MSEFALAMMLALCQADPARARAEAARSSGRCTACRSWPGQTLGILGLGTIGAAVAEKAAAFGMRVIGTQREPKPVPHVDLVFGGPEGTERVLRES